jgi:hypothetical protein
VYLIDLRAVRQIGLSARDGREALAARTLADVTAGEPFDMGLSTSFPEALREALNVAGIPPELAFNGPELAPLAYLHDVTAEVIPRAFDAEPQSHAGSGD